MIKFEVKSRFTGAVKFTAEIDCEEGASRSIKLGLAVKCAVKNDADLSGANLRDAYLSGADLSGANLRDAYLSGTNLSDANLRGANLRDAYLRGADLSDAYLRGADLSDAYLRGADLSGADLSDAYLSGTNLRSFKSCLWMTLTENPHEAAGVALALKEGRVNGSTYAGECACLIGTIANVKGVDADTLDRNSRNPSEQWFLMIKTGDTPDEDTGGGFAAKMALQWVEEWLALQGVK